MDLDLHVDIYEPRDFTKPGPAGCNMCGGIVSESLVQALAVEGVLGREYGNGEVICRQGEPGDRPGCSRWISAPSAYPLDSTDPNG